MNTKLFFIGLTIGCAELLSGCASLNSHFDCPMKPGVMCESLDQVNNQVDQGVLGNESTKVACKNCNASKWQSVSTNSNVTTPNSNIGVNAADPVRYGETVMRVWLAPFQDKKDNYYPSAVVYTVVKPGYWIGRPVKAISTEGDKA